VYAARKGKVTIRHEEKAKMKRLRFNGSQLFFFPRRSTSPISYSLNVQHRQRQRRGLTWLLPSRRSTRDLSLRRTAIRWELRRCAESSQPRASRRCAGLPRSYRTGTSRGVRGSTRRALRRRTRSSTGAGGRVGEGEGETKILRSFSLEAEVVAGAQS
jgi:hypothetical protein